MKHIVAVLLFIGLFLGAASNAQEKATGKTVKSVKITSTAQKSAKSDSSKTIQKRYPRIKHHKMQKPRVTRIKHNS